MAWIEPAPAPAAPQPPAAPLVGNAPAVSKPSASVNLGGLNGNGAANPPAAATPVAPIAANPAQPQVAVSGLALTKSLQLGNLLQATAQLQARATAPA